MSIWRRDGSHLIFTLPRATVEPVLPYLDRYMMVLSEATGDAVEVVRREVGRRPGVVDVTYTLPDSLFDCGTRAVTANCLLVEQGEARFTIEPLGRSGESLVRSRAAGDNQMIGAVDYFDGERVRGWALDKAAPGKPVPVGVFLDNQLVGSVTASDMRRDIMRRHGGSGQAGFNVQLPNMVFDGRRRVLCVAPMSTLRPLRGGLFGVDLDIIEGRVLTLLRERFERLDRLLE